MSSDNLHYYLTWSVVLTLNLLVTLPGVLLNLVVIYISVYKVDKPYKWFLANLAVTDFIFAAYNMIGQSIFLGLQLKEHVVSPEYASVSHCRLVSASLRAYALHIPIP